jgi:predicted ATPase
MLDRPISFNLPKPWVAQQFSIDRLGPLSFLVGPNGSGKSRFSEIMQRQLPSARLLGTNRLDGMSRSALSAMYGDNLANGYQKASFERFRQAGNEGSGIDVFVILEERPDIRIIVEATLSSLFSRDITLEWDSGNLVPKARMSRTGDSYRLDREECHGIRELLVLLTHLHDDRHEFLIIDEPELNLHPQFQSFFIQEARKIAGKHTNGSSKKCIVLITHSPFILDLRTIDEVQSIFCFSADHRPPNSIGPLDDKERARVTSLIPRLNVHHKQLFFADHPIFVEGVTDSQIIEAIQERRKTSITAAGSCLIDVGGCEELTKYVELCRKYGKEAFFLFDLDSLFGGSLRQCLRDDGSIVQFLASLGLGTDFAGYCGYLDQELTKAVRGIESAQDANGAVASLQTYFHQIVEGPKKLAQQRVAVLIEIASHRDEIIAALSETLVVSIEGRLTQVKSALESRNIYLLRGGALEHHLPQYQGHRYSLSEASKKKAVYEEIELLASGSYDDSLAERYGELFSIITKFPSKPPVDTDSVLRRYIGDYIHELQGLVVGKPDWDKTQIVAHFAASSAGLNKLITLSEFTRGQKDGEFNAVLTIGGVTSRSVVVSHDTNAGMRRFDLRVDA